MQDEDIAAIAAQEPEARLKKIYSFRDKLAQRISSSAKLHSASGQPDPSNSRVGSLEMGDGASPALKVDEHSKTNSHFASSDQHTNNPSPRLVEHLRCAECHNLGQLVGEVTIASNTLVQRQNNTTHNLRMLIRDASAALETILQSQKQVCRTQGGLNDNLEHLTASCSGCIVLSSGITKPLDSADLTDETPMRQSLTNLISTIKESKECAKPEGNATSMDAVEGWVTKVKHALDREDIQREDLQGELSTLEAAAIQRQAPFESREPTTPSVELPRALGAGESGAETAEDNGPEIRRRSTDGSDSASQKVVLREGFGREGLYVQGKAGGSFKIPPPNWR